MVLKQVLSDLTVDFPPLELLLSCKIPCDVNVLFSVREEGKGTEGVGSNKVYYDIYELHQQISKTSNLNSLKIQKAMPLQTSGKANWFPAQFEPQLHPVIGCVLSLTMQLTETSSARVIMHKTCC